MAEILEPAVPDSLVGLQLDASDSRNESRTSSAGTALAGLMCLSEILPVNFATLSVIPFSDNHALTTICFTAATLATETAGAVGSAMLIDRGVANWPVKWAGKVLTRLRHSDEATKVPTDLAATVIAGTVALNVFKQAQQPERTLRQNSRYGVLMGIGNSAISGVGIWLATEGIYHPNPETITLSGMTVLGALGLTRAIKRKFTKARQP